LRFTGVADAWVAYTEEQSHEPAPSVQRQVEETGMPLALRASSMLMHVEAIRAGTGRGVVPCYIGDGHPLLERGDKGAVRRAGRRARWRRLGEELVGASP
jgi:hypothetical protein